LIPLAEIEAARDRIAGAAVRTPLVQLPDTDVWLKLENLQPVSSFKIRGATNAVRAASAEQLAGGVVTASAGNMAQGLAWAAREAGVPATIICPDHAPQTKLDRIERLGGRVIQVPWERWWQTIVESRFDGVDGLFVHPVQNELVMAGNGTIGLELVEDLPDLETVLVPYGGGGLSVGIASAVKQLRPGVRVYAVDPETGPSATAAFEAGEPTTVEHRTSFVDGSGGIGVLEAMWPYVREALDGAYVVSLEETAAALRLLAERIRVVAEGAGALALAAARSGRTVGGKTVCIVSGGNIDTAVLTRILAGETPT
jgi:threonine dehydratase